MILRSRFLFLISILVLALLITGCSKQKKPNQTPGRSKAAVVTSVGGIDDLSFNAMAWEGLKRAGKDFGVDVKFVESKKQSDYASNLQKLAEQGYDLVFAVGFPMEYAVAQTAPKYPKTKFVIIDGNAPKVANAAALKFREEEGAFLAGALAGSMTKTGTIGFIGGMDIPLIKKFECGYKGGALTVRPTVKFLTAYTGKWDDPAKGKELAMSQFGQGADIVYHAAGSSGLGVIDAAKTKGASYYAIGSDADQDYLAPGRVLTSMMKRVDNVVYDTCKSVKDGTFTPGDHTFGLKEGGIGLSPMKYTKKAIDPKTLARIEALKILVIDGKLKPPKTEKELKSFRAPGFCGPDCPL